MTEAENQEFFFCRAAVPYLRPATQYEFWVTGFTQKREGVSSPVLRTRTDTAKPGPPVITNTNCTGALIGNQQIEQISSKIAKTSQEKGSVGKMAFLADKYFLFFISFFFFWGGGCSDLDSTSSCFAFTFL